METSGKDCPGRSQRPDRPDFGSHAETPCARRTIVPTTHLVQTAGLRIKRHQGCGGVACHVVLSAVAPTVNFLFSQSVNSKKNFIPRRRSSVCGNLRRAAKNPRRYGHSLCPNRHSTSTGSH